MPSISPCNVLYKIVSETMANKLQKLLLVLHLNQSAFVLDRLRVDSILIALKSLHAMKCWYVSKRGTIALSLYIGKEYRSSWLFLERVLLRSSSIIIEWMLLWDVFLHCHIPSLLPSTHDVGDFSSQRAHGLSVVVAMGRGAVAHGMCDIVCSIKNHRLSMVSTMVRGW